MGSITRDNAGYVEQSNAANVWMNGSRQIDQSSRFSNQSLDQAWDNRGNGRAYAQTSVSRQGHSRNNSSSIVSNITSFCISLQLIHADIEGLRIAPGLPTQRQQPRIVIQVKDSEFRSM